MALPSIGGGQQIGDGNSEIMMGVQPTPTAKTAAATLTAAELATGIITYDGGVADLTLPTVANLEATLTNAKVNSCFDFIVLNIDSSGSDTVTVVTNTGWTLVGTMTIAAAAARQFRARKTGAAAWTLYQIS